MSRNIYHIHHIVPKHTWKKLYGSLDGVDIESNLIKLTVSEHASWHYELWCYFGCWEDYIAWKGLSSQIGKDEFYSILYYNAGKKGGEKIRDNNLGIYTKNILKKKEINHKISQSMIGRKGWCSSASKDHPGIQLLSEKCAKNMYKLINILNQEEIIFTNMVKFCREKQCSRNTIFNMLKSNKPNQKGPFKNWKCIKL